MLTAGRPSGIIPGPGLYNVVAVAQYEDGHRTVLPEIQIVVKGAELIVSISVVNGKAYEVADLAVGVEQYIDRNFTVTSFPSQLEGATLIRTANDDKSFGLNSFFTIELGLDADVYIAYDQNATQLPGWLDNWTNTGEQFLTSDESFLLYHKSIQRGSLTLGGNLAVPAEGADSNYSVIVAPKADTPVSVEDPIDDTIPKTLVLGQNYPNTFNPQTTIDFAIPQSGFTTLKLFNTLGQEVKSLVEANLQAGVIYKITVDGSRFPSGLYIYTLRSRGLVTSKKMILMK